MDASAAAAPGLTVSFEKLILSSVRLSSAATLFGVYQLESAVNGFQPDGLGKQMDRFGETVDSLSQCFVTEISPGKKSALESIADLSGKVVKQSIEGFRLFDPRQAMRIATKLAQQSSEALRGKSASAAAAPEDEPKLAADVLGK